MSRSDDALQLLKLLTDNPDGLHKDTIRRRLGIRSDATFYRVLEHARSIPGVVIEPRKNSYLLTNPPDNKADPFVPADDDLMALVCLQHILTTMTSDALADVFRPVQQKLNRHLKSVNRKYLQWPDRIKILDIHFRKISEGVFGSILKAVMHKRVIKFTYISSSSPTSDRTVSPQQIVRYKDNWYLDAWCHRNEELRIFSLDSMRRLRYGNTPFKTVASELLKEVYTTSYGIFSGTPDHTAVIRFTGIAARYVLREKWHPKQKLKRAGKETVLLEIPYGKPQELIKEILSWGCDAEVLAPESLRDAVAEALERAAAKYRRDGKNVRIADGTD